MPHVHALSLSQTSPHGGSTSPYLTGIASGHSPVRSPRARGTSPNGPGSGDSWARGSRSRARLLLDEEFADVRPSPPTLPCACPSLSHKGLHRRTFGTLSGASCSSSPICPQPSGTSLLCTTTHARATAPLPLCRQQRCRQKGPCRFAHATFQSVSSRGASWKHRCHRCQARDVRFSQLLLRRLGYRSRRCCIDNVHTERSSRAKKRTGSCVSRDTAPATSWQKMAPFAKWFMPQNRESRRITKMAEWAAHPCCTSDRVLARCVPFR